MTIIELIKSLIKKYQMGSYVINSLIFDDKFTVQLLKDTEEFKGRNVICLDREGNEIWRIDPDPLNPSFSYVSILKQNGNLIAINFSTNQVEIDYKTGEIISNRWVK